MFSQVAIWCLVRSDQLKVPPSPCGPVQLRTTEWIVRDHERFADAGGNLRNAKAYNKCICQPFFHLTQVRTCSHTYWINSHKRCTHTCTSDHIQYKEKQIKSCEIMKSVKESLMTLKEKRRTLECEVKKIKKSNYKSSWYYKKKPLNRVIVQLLSLTQFLA